MNELTEQQKLQRLSLLHGMMQPAGSIPYATERTDGFDYEPKELSPAQNFYRSFYNTFFVDAAKGLVQAAPIVGQAIAGDNTKADKFFTSWLKTTTPFFNQAKLSVTPTESFFTDPSMTNLAQGLGQGLGFLIGMAGGGMGATTKFGSYALGSTFAGMVEMPMLREEAIANGISEQDAAKFAAIAAPILGMSEYISVPLLGKVIEKPAINAIRKKAVEQGVKEFVAQGANRSAAYSAAETMQKVVINGIKDKGKEIASKGVSGVVLEGLQEFGQSYLETGVKQIYDTFFSKDVDKRFGADVKGKAAFVQALEEGMYGAILGGVMGAGGGALYTNVAEESMFNYIDKSKDKQKAASTIKNDLLGLQKSGRLTDAEVEQGISLVDKLYDFSANKINPNIKNGIARLQILRLQDLQNDLIGQQSSDPSLTPDYIGEQIAAVQSKIKEVVNSDIPIANFNSFLTEINNIEQKYKQDEKIQDSETDNAEAQAETTPEAEEEITIPEEELPTTGISQTETETKNEQPSVLKEIQDMDEGELAQQQQMWQADVDVAEKEIAKLKKSKAKKAQSELQNQEARLKRGQEKLQEIDGRLQQLRGTGETANAGEGNIGEAAEAGEEGITEGGEGIGAQEVDGSVSVGEGVKSKKGIAKMVSENIGGKPVGSVTTDKAHPKDIDIRIEGEYNKDDTEIKMNEMGYEFIGSSILSPQEMKLQPNKRFGDGWQRIEHFEDKKGNKIDVWHNDNSELISVEQITKTQQNATEKRNITESNQQQYPQAEEGGLQAEASNSNKPKQGGKGQKEIGISPNNSVKANQKIAAEEIAENRNLHPKDVLVLYSKEVRSLPVVDENNMTEDEIRDMNDKGVQGALDKNKIPPQIRKRVENLLEDGFLGYDMQSDGFFLTPKGKNVIDAIDARLATRKAVKEGTDMFPTEANIEELQSPASQQQLANKMFANNIDMNKSEDEIIDEMEQKGIIKKECE